MSRVILLAREMGFPIKHPIKTQGKWTIDAPRHVPVARDMQTGTVNLPIARLALEWK
jgi:hypothetical protein